MSAAAPPPPPAPPARKRRAPSQWDVKPAGYVEGAAVEGGAGAASSSGAPSQQTRHARRLYVGNVGDASEQAIESYFTELVRAAVRRPASAGASILSVYLNAERKFAFVEFASLELANAFADFDGLLFRGQPLKVRRPDDYNAHALTAEMRERKEAVDLAQLPLSQPPTAPSGGGRSGGGGSSSSSSSSSSSGGGGGGMHRIYIGSIPTALSEAQLRELVSAFGAVQKLDVPRQPDGAMRGYAFVEYADAAVTDTAIAAMDGLAVGDKKLSVSRAKTLAGGGGPVMAAAQAQQAQQQMGYPPHMGGGGGYGGLGGGTGLGGIAAPPPPYGGPRLVVLDNMVLAAEVVSEVGFRDLLGEIATECAKYGTLVDVTIPRPPSPAAGRVFLLYADAGGARVALQNLVGRQFSGRVIQGKGYDEAAFAAGALLH